MSKSHDAILVFASVRGSRAWGRCAQAAFASRGCLLFALRHFLLDRPGQSVEHHSRQIDLVTGVVDVDAHNPACGIVIDDNTGGEFLTVDARVITEGDRERVGVRTGGGGRGFGEKLERRLAESAAGAVPKTPRDETPARIAHSGGFLRRPARFRLCRRDSCSSIAA